MTTFIESYEKEKEYNELEYLIKNGIYIPFLHIFLFAYTEDLFLSSIIAFKFYPANYYFWFYPLYNYDGLPLWVSFFKQFVRFTDTGHLASLLYLYNPAFFSITYNVHFAITFGYWLGKLFFGLKDADDRNNKIMLVPFMEWWSACNHLCPLLLMIRELWIKQDTLCQIELFTYVDLYYSFIWGYFWLAFIYLPWRIVTKDCVYSVLSDKEPALYQGLFLFMIHVLFYISNKSGHMIQNYICL
jgi:hypothetical protein